MSDKSDKPLDEIKCEPLEGYNHIFKLNGFSLTSKTISFYKYMSLDRFVNSVEKKELVFVFPKTWNDYIQNHIISKVMLVPHPAVEPSTAIGKIYKQLHNIQTKKMKNQVDKLLNKSGITYQCRLYESKPPIVIE